MEYRELIEKMELRTLKDSEDYDRAIKMSNMLLDIDCNEDEDDYLNVLSLLIEEYENRIIPIPNVEGYRVLEHLIEIRNITYGKVSKLTGIGTNELMQILEGSRELNDNYAERLSKFFNVPKEVFIK